MAHTFSKLVLSSLPNLPALPLPFFLTAHLKRHPTQTRPLLVLFTLLLLLRSRVVPLGGEVGMGIGRALMVLVRALRRNRKGKEKDEGQISNTEMTYEEALQRVYLPGENGTKTLLVPSPNLSAEKKNQSPGKITKIPIKPTPPSKFTSDVPYFAPLPATVLTKPSLDASFIHQLSSLLFRIVFPSPTSKGDTPAWRSEEAGLVAAHSFFLVLRTVLSILVARLDGVIVRDLVRGDLKGFGRGLVGWFLLAAPSAGTNSMIRHLQSLLALKLRTRVTRYLHDLYLSANPDLRYYRAGVEGVDQYLTADVEAWAGSLSGLYGNLLKPTLDLLLFTSQLSRSLGVRGTILLFLNYYGTVAILRSVTPAFGRLAATEARLEGEYRRGVGRVGRESEEVAFYDGGRREKENLEGAYLRLIKHVNGIYKIRIAYEWTEDYVIKYLWSAAGYALIAVPILYTRTKRSFGIRTGTGGDETEKRRRDKDRDDAVAGRTETYISNRRLLLSLADAGGRLMYAYKDLLELAGLTTRLYTLTSTLLNMPPGKEPVWVGKGEAISLEGVDVRVPRVRKGVGDGGQGGDGEEGGEGRDEADPPLVRDLNLRIEPGEHLMITGSNGVGKTAVARVLAGLWDPAGGGVVKMPLDGDDPIPDSGSESEKPPLAAYPRPWSRPTVYVVPQRSYMVTGSLLEQVIYPCSYASFLTYASNPRYSPCGLPGALTELQSILDSVFLGYLPQREGGWSTRKEWRDVLSGGEKQRMGVARVVWWKPKYVVLDECTSAVSGDVEGGLYEVLKAGGSTLITISLRPSLMKYHKQVLTLSGPEHSHPPASVPPPLPASASAPPYPSPSTTPQPPSWTLTRVGTKEERMSVAHEVQALEKKLEEVEGWEKRVVELDRELWGGMHEKGSEAEADSTRDEKGGEVGDVVPNGDSNGEDEDGRRKMNRRKEEMEMEGLLEEVDDGLGGQGEVL